MDEQQTNDLITSTTAALNVAPEESKKSIFKPFAELGEGFGNTLYLIFSPILKARISREAHIEDFQSKILDKYLKIPNENRINSPLNIIGPSLEAAKYHIEEDEIRKLFANLIGNSMDSSKLDKVHPSFVEIIKQLTPFDAQLIKTLINLPKYGRGIAQIKFMSKKSVTFLVFNHVLGIPNLNEANIKLFTASIDNLLRLSLIQVEYGINTFADKKHYDAIRSGSLFKNCSASVEDASTRVSIETDDEISSAVIVEGTWSFTAYGQNFINIVFSDIE